MNRLQQEIKDFHGRIKPVLKKVLEQYNKNNSKKIYNKIIKPCKKLIQKCSCKSVSDMGCLCSLAYWLYIYGSKELALAVCETVHNIECPLEFRDFNGGAQNIYGLEIRIARELLGEDRKSDIPPALLEYCFSKRVRKEMEYPQVLREERIDFCDGRFLDMELLLALYNVTGLGETGLYTSLNENWEEVEETINLYIYFLKMD